MMLAQRTAAPATATCRVQALGLPAIGRRSVIRRADGKQRVEDLKEGAAEARDKVKDALNSAGSAFQNDPQGINRDYVDSSQYSPLGDKTEPFRHTRSEDQQQYRAPFGILVPAFTRRREVQAGRLAIVGFFASVFIEIFGAGHQGPLAQVAGYTGLSTQALSLLFLGLIVHGLSGVITPATQSRENKDDVAKRPTGMNDGVSPLKDLGNAVGVSDSVGFTKKNELFNGRMAMLGFFFAILGELRGGGGAVAQIAQWLGNEPTEQWFNGAGKVLAAWSLFLLASSFINGRMGEIEGDESVY